MALGEGKQQLLSFLLAGVVIVLRALSRARVVPPFELTDDGMVIPVAPGSSRSQRVPYADVLSLHVLGPRGRERVVVGLPSGVLAFPLAQFTHPDAAMRLRAMVRARMALQPDGRRLLAAMQSREELSKEAWRTRPWVTPVLLGLIFAMWLVQTWLGDVTSLRNQILLGGNSPVLVKQGQWFRLVTANFLHGHWIHIAFNALALQSLGSLLERLAGGPGLIVIYLVSALGGATASAMLSKGVVSVGASTAIFGLLGALAWVSFRFPRELPAGFRQSHRWWLIILLVNAGLPVLFPIIDWAAHAGGFIVGGLVTAAVCWTPESVRPGAPSSAPVRVVARLLIAGFLIAAGYAAARAGANIERDVTNVMNSLRASPGNTARLNEAAWYIAIDPRADDGELSRALGYARKALEQEERPEVLDTLATVLYRSGKLEDAVRTQWRALQGDDSRSLWSQFARFSRALHTRSGTFWSGGPAATPSPGVEVGQDGEGRLQWRMEVGCVPASGASYYAVGHDADGIVGVVRVHGGGSAGCETLVASALPSQAPGMDLKRWLSAGWELTAASLSGCQATKGAEPGCAPGAKMVVMDPEVAAYP